MEPGSRKKSPNSWFAQYLVKPYTSLKVHPTKPTNTRLILSVNPSDLKLFFFNSTIRRLHTNMSPETSATNIGFGPQWHTSATTTVYSTPNFDQSLQHRFQPDVNGYQVIADTTNVYTPLVAQTSCEFSKPLALLQNLTLKDDTMINFF